MECSICLDTIEEIKTGEHSYLVESITKNYKNAKSLPWDIYFIQNVL